MSSFGIVLYCSVLIVLANANETPILGILSQEKYLVQKAYPKAHSFIAASYVKLLEGSGARVIPVWIGQDDEYYRQVVAYTNGMLFPGGGTYFNESGGYGEATKKIYRFAQEANEKGIYYPLWGICLGMQAMVYAQVGKDIRGDCDCKKVALPLQFEAGYDKSRLYSTASRQILEDFSSKNLTYNYHQYCIFEKDLRDSAVLDEWHILSKNRDIHGVEFISSMEHRTYPFYAVQYHPEKNLYEFDKPTGIPHGHHATQIAQFLANFFVDESRKNDNRFPTRSLENKTLIYNYKPDYSHGVTSYEQLYLFVESDYERKFAVEDDKEDYYEAKLEQ